MAIARDIVTLLAVAMLPGCTATLSVEGVVEVLPGTFEMGCTGGQWDCAADETAHVVTLRQAYLVGVTEVTQRQFEAALGYDPSHFSHCGATCPVETVSWHEAAAYANALSAQERLSECFVCTGSGKEVECAVVGNPYDCGGYRLLTEAEWEWAARCGQDLTYSGANRIAKVGWIGDNSDYETHAAGELEPNACGLYDMSGNVYEWTMDGYADYDGAAVDPVGDPEAAERVMRGGSYAADDAWWARVALRYHLPPEIGTADYVGFRIARSIRSGT